MKKDVMRYSLTTRRNFCLFLTFAFFHSTVGCSLFKSEKKGRCSDFSDQFDDEDQNQVTEKENVFDSERDRQSQLSEYLAQTGRSSKTKKKVSSGDTFLFSDKAKEIYANTER